MSGINITPPTQAMPRAQGSGQPKYQKTDRNGNIVNPFLAGTVNASNVTTWVGPPFSTIDLQTAYDNGAAGLFQNIQTSATNGPVSIQDYAGSGGAPIFAVTESGGAPIISISDNDITIDSGASLTNFVLDKLSDVTISAVANNNILMYDSGTSEWVNRPGPPVLTVAGTANQITSSGTTAITLALADPLISTHSLLDSATGEMHVGGTSAGTGKATITNTASATGITVQGVNVFAGAQYGILSNPTTTSATLQHGIASAPVFRGASVASAFTASPLFTGNAATIPTAIGFYFDGGGATVGTITDAYGIYIQNPVGGTNRFGGYIAGNLGLKQLSPSHTLHLGDDDAAKTATNTWTVTSDQRIKKEIGAVSGSIQVIKDLLPRTFKFTEDYCTEYNLDPNETHLGFVADEVEAVCPECVKTTDQKLEAKDNLKSFNPHAIYVHLVQAVKELIARVEALEAK
jgi:hypothetical protein